MNHPILIIHKKEWVRIKRIEKPPNNFKEKEEYIKSLTEQSRKYIEKWDDSVLGHVNKFEKQKEIKYAKAIQAVKDFKSRKKLENNEDVIKKAKELIFQDSCYGRQLLSAFLESKALEEREAQVKFQHEIKKKYEHQKNVEPQATSLPFGNTDLEEKQKINNKKLIALEIAQINKALCQNKYKEISEKRDKEKQNYLENESLNKLILKNENILETEKSKREQHDIEIYKKLNDQIKKARAEADVKEDLIREVWRKYDDKIKCRERSVYNKIHKESCNTTRSQNIYKIVKQINYEKEKKYNDYIETGIKQHLKRLNEQDQEEFESKTNERIKRKLLDKDNKLLIELKKQINLNIDSNCCTQNAYVQGIPVNKSKTPKKDSATKKYLLAPDHKLLEKRKRRENNPSSWTGLNDAHAQFGEHASDILRQCRYKNMARKIINDYRRINCIDEKTLPISD